MNRRIIHLDMDAFYASVEQRDQPELKGRPVIVGGSLDRGVVCACSYEARPFGVRSAMGMAKALRLCPQAVVLPVRMERYREASRQVFGIFSRYTDLVEPLSLDEAFLDVTDCGRLFGSAREIATRIRQEVYRGTGLTVSAGIAANKFLAKLASDAAKPNGQREVKPEEADSFLLPLPLSRIWGVGRVTASTLERRGYRTVADLRKVDRNTMVGWMGSFGETLYCLIRGVDERSVEPDGDVKSIGQEETFERDLWLQEDLHRELLALSEKVTFRLRQRELAGRTVTLKVKYGDFATVTRSRTLSRALDSTPSLYAEAMDLLKKTDAGSRPVRLLGISLSALVSRESSQTELFGREEKDRQSALDEAMDRVRERFGEGGIRRGTLLEGSSPGKKGTDGK